MITVFLRGGLGNQMFQYAAGLSLAKRNNTGLLLDTVFLGDRFPRRDFAYRTFDLDIFGLHPRLTPLSKMANAAPIPGVWLALDLVSFKLGAILGFRKVIKEKQDHVVDQRVVDAHGNAVLWGRWQHEGYFKDIEADVRGAFRFRNQLIGEAGEIAKKIALSNSVSLHVRRGDFGASKVVNALMGDTNLAYYNDAVHYMGAHVENPHFFIISDDVAWCREHLKIDGSATYVPADAAGPKGGFHLQLMSLCKHNIIANSTFSWWGAWLNANPGKIVVAPKQWYGDSTVKEDIVPREWIRV